MKHLLLAAAFIASPAMAKTYIGVGGGLAIPKDTRLEMKTNALRVKTDDGWNANVVAGYQAKRVRFELEARRAQMTVSRISDAKGRVLDLTAPSNPRR